MADYADPMTAAANEPHQAILLELALLMNERRSVADVFAAFAERLMAATRFEFTALATVEPDPRYMRIAGRHPNWEGSMPVGTILRQLDLPPQWQESGVDGVEYHPGPGDPEVGRRQYERGLRHGWVANLRVGDTSYGYVTVARTTVDAVSPAELDFLRAGAHLLASAVRQDRLLRDAEQEAAQSQLLNELAALLHAGEPIGALFDRMLDLIALAIKIDYVSVSVSTASGGYRMVGSRPVLRYAVGEEYPGDVAQADNVFMAAGGVLEYRPERNEGHWPSLYRKAGIRRVIAAGLRSGDQRLGIIGMGRKSNVAFTDRERRFVVGLAVMLGQAEANYRRLEQIAAAAARERVLSELAVLLSAGEPVDSLFDSLPAFLNRAIDCDYVGLVVTGETAGLVRVVGSHPELIWRSGTILTTAEAEFERIPAVPGVVQAETRDVVGSPPLAVLSANGIRRIAVTALHEGDRLAGRLTIGRQMDAPYPAEDVEFIEIVATLLGQAVVNQERVRRMAAEAARARALNELTILLNAGEPVEALFDRLLPLLERAIEFDYVGLLVSTGEPGMLRQAGSRPELIRPAGTLVDFETAAMAPVADSMGLVQYRTDRVAAASSPALLQAGIMRDAAIALRDGNEPVGMFDIARRRNVRYSPEEAGFIETLATILGQAVGNQRHMQHVEAEAARARILNELGTLLNAGEPIDALFDRLLPLLERAIEFDFVSLSVAADDEPGMLRQVGSRPELLRPRGALVGFETVGMKPIADVSGVVQYRSDRVPGEPDAILSREGIIRVAVIALRDVGEPVGMFAVARRRNVPYASQEVEFIDSVATILSQVVANRRRLQRIETEAARAHVLNELTVLLNAGEPVDSLFDRLLALLERALEFDYVALLVSADRPGVLRMVGSRPVLVREAGDEVDEQTAGLRELARAPGVVQYRTGGEPSLSSRVLADSGMPRAAAAALRAAGEPVGMFSLGRRRDTHFSAAEIEFIEVVATILGQAVGNQQRLEAARAEGARSQLLNEVALLVNAGEPAHSFFERLRELLLGAMHFDRIALLVAEDGGEQLRVVGATPTSLFEVGDLVPATAVPGDPDDPGGCTVHDRPLVDVDSEMSRRGQQLGYSRVTWVTMRDGPQLLGVFIAGRRADLPLSPWETDLLTLLATLLSQSLANERRLQRAAAAAARNKLLTEMAVLLKAGEPPRRFFERLGEMLQAAVKFDGMALLVAEADGEQLRVEGSLRNLILKTGTVLPTGQVLAGPPPADGHLVHQILTSGIGSATADLLHHAGVVRVASAILREGEALLGVLTVGRAADVPFAPDEMEVLELLATLLGQAMANEQRLRRTRAEAARNKLLSELAVLLNAGEPVETVFQAVVELLKEIVPWDRAALLEMNDARTALRPICALPGDVLPAGEEMPLAPALLASASFRSRLSTIPAPQAERVAAAGGDWLLATALRQGGHLLGAFHLVRDSDDPFTDEETRFVELLATLLAQALAAEQRMQKAQAEAARQRLLNELAILLNAGEKVEVLFDLLPPLLSSAIAFHYVGLAFEAGRPGYFRTVDWNALVPAPATPTWVRTGALGLERAEAAAEQVTEYVFHAGSERAGSAAEGFAAAGLKHSLFGRLGSVEEPLGVLHVGRATDEPFAPADVAFLEVVTTIFTQAVANQARIESAAAEAEEQRMVAAVAAAAATATSPGELVATIIEPLRRLIPRPFLAFGYLEGDEVVYPVPNAKEVRWPLDSYQRMAIQEGQIHAHTVPDDLDRASPLWTFRVYANATTLARSGGEPMGILLNGSRQKGYTFGRRELRIFRLIAQIIGPAMENARAAERVKREAEEQRIIAEVATVAARESDAIAVLRGLVEPFRGILPRAFIGYGHILGDRISYSVSATEELQLDMSAPELRARDGHQAVGDARELEPHHPGHRWELKQISLTPVWSGGVVTGLLNVASRDADFVFGERELRLLREIARIVGPAIEAARAAESVAQQRALYDLILRSLNEGVVLLDAESRTRFENSFGQAVLGSIDPSRQTRGVDEVSQILPSKFRGEFRAAMREGVPASGRAQLSIAGEQRWVDYDLIPLNDDRFRLLFVTTDVTEAVRREEETEQHRQQIEQAARLAALGELIGGVAHELNNPLTAILGFAEIIARTPGASSLTEEVSIIQKEAIRARDIVRDLLFIARPAPVEQTEVVLGDVVAHIERLRRAAWLTQQATVTIDVAADGCLVWGNQNQLTQVLLNLVTNAEHAIEGLPRREISITVARKAEAAEIVVADSGAGMSPETAERVFEPFFTTKQGTGTGLGLSLSYSIIQSHQGQITVESHPGEGTRFRITLPARAPGAPATPAPLSLTEARAVRVLVIDDEPSLRRVCQRLVQSMGHECEVAESSAAGLALAASKDFDLVLCDYRLATETAADVVEGLAAVAPHLIPRTVIATGATTDAGVVELTERYGLRLIAKPYGVEDLAAIIAEARQRVDAGL